MKTFLTVFFASSLSFAAQQGVLPHFTCQSEIPATTFTATPGKDANGEFVDLSVDHHFGLGSVPIHSGLVIANDIQFLQQKAEVLKKLGESFKVRFKKENCESFGSQLYSCFSRDTIKINGAEINGFSFVTRLSTIKVYSYIFKSNQVVFSFIHESRSYDMPMSYYDKECKFE